MWIGLPWSRSISWIALKCRALFASLRLSKKWYLWFDRSVNRYYANRSAICLGISKPQKLASRNIRLLPARNDNPLEQGANDETHTRKPEKEY